MRRFWQLLALSITVFVTAVAAQTNDLGKMGADEIKALQQRLADGHCYQGAIDGQAGPALQDAIEACPLQDPMLRIETGMHVAPVRAIGVDLACRMAATGSDDKTLRIWSLPEGRLLHTFRTPVGRGDAGKINAVAVSPEGRWIAAGGWDAEQERAAHTNYVYIFDALTGAIVDRVGPFGNAIQSLTFSPDSRWLAAIGGTGAGLKLIDAQSWRIVAEDDENGDVNYGVAFAPDDRVYTVSYDGKLRQYGPGPDFKKEREVATKGGKEPLSVAVDPHGQLVAVGFHDTQAVDVYDASTLNFRFAVDSKGIDNGNLSKVTWSRDGAKLFAGGTYPITGKSEVIIFDRDGKRVAAPVPLSDDTISDLEPCSDSIAVAASDPAFGIIDGNGRVNLWKTGVTPNMLYKRDAAFTIAPNAKQVRFGLGEGAEDPIVFDLGQATVTAAPDPVPSFHVPLIDGLPISDWKNSYNPTIAGKPIALNQHEMSRSLAIRPDRKAFVLGTAYWLRAFDSDGTQLWQRPGPGEARGVNISDDGRIVVVAYSDGTIRWHRWSDGKELLAFFVNRKTKTWVAWTPAGYYKASPGGEDLIGWHLNRGWNQAADFFPASKFHGKYSRADVVDRVLDALDEGEAIRQADLARPQKAAAQTPILESLPPVLSILSPADDEQVDTANVRINYLVRSPSGTPIDGVEALINGAPAGARGTGDDSGVKKCIGETRGLGRTTGALQGCRGSLTITLPPGVSEIGVFARAGAKSSDPAEIRVTRTSPPTAAEIEKPKLYALIAGISDYPDPLTLKFASKDAHDFAAALANQNGALYSEVSIKLFVDKQATAIAIKDGLDWLAHQVTDRDVGVVYLAGHGILDEHNRFFFLAADSDPNRLKATAVAKDDIAETLENLAGKALLFLDACHSGSMAGAGRRSAFDNSDVVNDFLHSDRGVVVFAASTGRQVSMEDPSWNNGAFTKALVEGLGSPGVPSRAKLADDDAITPKLLDAYIARRVKVLTDGKQSPVMVSTAPEFPLAIAR
jgi:WD40 repeat protein